MPDLFEQLKIGDNIDIVVFRPGKDRIAYRSRIEDMFQGDAKAKNVKYMQKQLLIPVPTTPGALGTIAEASSYELAVYKGSAKYIFKAIIVDRLRIVNSFYYLFQVIDNGTRINSRNFFRADIMMDIEFVVMKSKKNEEEPQVELYGEEAKPKKAEKAEGEKEKSEIRKGTSRDISGGGMQFVSAEDIDVGDYITLYLTFEKERMFLTGKVMMRDKLPDKKYLYRVMFLGVSNKEQDMIIKFVLDVERKSAFKAR
jgi:c-di-GMP-binding flagellar brake protein YcgR